MNDTFDSDVGRLRAAVQRAARRSVPPREIACPMAAVRIACRIASRSASRTTPPFPDSTVSMSVARHRAIASGLAFPRRAEPARVAICLCTRGIRR